MSSAKPVAVVEYSDWDVNNVKYMPPRLNDKGGKAITIISTQTSRSLAVTTAPMTTWGISDFCDENGVSDGKYKLALQFPREQYKTPETEEFLVKMKAFEQRVIDDAVLNSELWWGKKKNRELVEDAFFPYLKYPKDEKKVNYDYTKAPNMTPKVPCYNGEWGTRIFDVDYNKIFPNADSSDVTPMDFVPKSSQVVCALKCNGVWIGGKGWGITWQVDQIIVKPRVVNRVNNDICHIKLSGNFGKSSVSAEEPVDAPVPLQRRATNALPEPTEPVSTEVPDSDDENDEVPETHEEQEQTLDELVAEAEALVEEVMPAPVVKKVIKKAVVPVAAPVEEAAPAPAVKKVVKKKV
jgi:hypothetical protein